MNPKGGDDVVMTPPELANAIVEHFKPSGICLEPCRGSQRGAFYQAMWIRAGVLDWYEITEGRDFLDSKDWEQPAYSWIITNPPWSKFRAFLIHSMKVADNVVFLAPMNHWCTKARHRDMIEAGFGMVETLIVPTPKAPWPQSGFTLAATWIRRGWTGGQSLTRLN
jgi:hypothetical protein